MIKLDVLDVHDRLKHFTKQSFDIGECCQNLIDQRPYGDHAFYIFAHARTAEDGVTKEVIWQPRLTKPKAQTNSMLFKVKPGSDIVKVIWIIPPRELWAEFEYGKMMQDRTISESIHDFSHNRGRLEAPEEDDLSEHEIDMVYKEISLEARKKNALCQ